MKTNPLKWKYVRLIKNTDHDDAGQVFKVEDAQLVRFDNDTVVLINQVPEWYFKEITEEEYLQQRAEEEIMRDYFCDQ